MKDLSDYMADEHTAAFEEFQAFFAFSNEQLEKGLEKHNFPKEPKPKLSSLGMGLYCKSGNAPALMDRLDDIHARAVAQQLKDYGIKKIIAYQLSNHECYYTHSIENAMDALEPFDVTREQVEEIYSAELEVRCIFENIGGENFWLSKFYLGSETIKGGVRIGLADNDTGANLMEITFAGGYKYDIVFYKFTAIGDKVVCAGCNGVDEDQALSSFNNMTGFNVKPYEY